ncbi:ComEC/Rec2 family competence protein [Pedobacter nutrimenti]|uniref:ComEC/Rec2 family competence protein n=1 Tax=Pedobacter nutrimenti TaxID=1241337 RepID=UPI00292E7B31|nr:ComEC/Rec2 family competence protein [Pedobacter nutrimenti]
MELKRQETIFLQLPLLFATGIVLGYSSPSIFLLNTLLTASVLLFIGLLLLNFFYSTLRIYRFKHRILLMVYLLIIFLGALHYLLQKELLRTDHFSKAKFELLKVQITEEPQLRNNTQLHFVAKVTGGLTKGNYQACTGHLLISVQVNNRGLLPLKYGDVLIVKAKYQVVAAPLLSSTFDFRSWLAMQNIYHQAYFKKEDIRLLKRNKGNLLISYALNLRKKQVDIYKKFINDPQAYAVASTLILGYRSDLSSETLDAYAKTGTIHALSVSGMHVGIIYLVLNWILFFLNRSPPLLFLKALFIILIIWFYALVTGFSPSVLRSAIMITILILSKILRKKTNSYNVLGFSAFSLLLYEPFLLFDIGFQLSYLSVIGLIWLQPKICTWFSFKSRWMNKLWSILAMSLSAQLTTFPLSIYYFHQFPVYFLFSNLFIMIPAALMMYIGLIMLLFKFYFLAAPFEWLICFTNSGLRWISDLPFASISAIWINRTELLCLSTGLILFTLSLSYAKKKLLFTSLFFFSLLELSMFYQQILAQRQQKVIVFRLKRNYTGIYIKSNKAILITDVSPESAAFRFYIKPYLDQHRITEVDFKFSYQGLKKIKHL